MGTEESTPSPDAPPSGRVPFQTTFRKVCVVVTNLTAAFVVLRELGPFAAEGGRFGWREALPWFVVTVTVKGVLAVAFNCFAVALPVAGAIHYFRYLARPR